MARSLTSGMQTAIAGDAAVSVLLIQMAFSSGTLYITNAPANLSWNGQTWLGVGGQVSVQSINETGDVSGWGADLTLAGVDQTVIALLLGAQYIGRAITIYRAYWNDATGLVIASPDIAFSGFMNGSWTIEEQRQQGGRDFGTVTVTTRVTERLSGLDQRRGIQPNLASHQAYYPGDKFFELVGQVAFTPITWKR